MLKLRFLAPALILVSALGLAGCKTQSASNAAVKANQPIPSKTVALMEEKGMRKQDPILVRIYKEDSQLEIWKKRQADGRYALLKTYEICRWSGALGPKKKEGDKQAPEGFYAVSPALMNPNSNYYLSFNIGFPNAFDRSLGRDGRFVMVHGDCLSAGCYAMTDKQMAEIYALAREAFAGGQRAFQIQALPFRMTPENMARRRNDPNFAFWKNLKVGADHFEVSHLEPKVDVCGHKYVFDATPTSGAGFQPSEPCPAFQVQPSIALAVNAKERQDEKKFAALVGEGMQVAEAYVPQNGRLRRTLDQPIHRPTMVASTAPAAAPVSQTGTALAMAEAVPMPVPSPYQTATASASQPSSSGSLFGWLRGSDEKSAPQAQPAAQPIPANAAPASHAPSSRALASTTPNAARPAVVAPSAAHAAAPAMASAVPVSQERPFYRRLFDSTFGFMSDKEAAPVPAATTAPVPTPAKRDRTAWLQR